MAERERRQVRAEEQLEERLARLEERLERLLQQQEFMTRPKCPDTWNTGPGDEFYTEGWGKGDSASNCQADAQRQAFVKAYDGALRVGASHPCPGPCVQWVRPIFVRSQNLTRNERSEEDGLYYTILRVYWRVRIKCEVEAEGPF